MVRLNARSGPVVLAATSGPALLVGILATVVSLRTPLWRDEIATLSFAELPFADLMQAITHVDSVLLPYYIVAHVTQVVMPGPLGLRLPSILGVMIATAATSAIAGRWWGSWAAGAAGLALAVNPLLITQGSTARPYALAICFVALAGLALAQALWPRSRPDGDTRTVVAPWVGYAVCIALAGLMHLFSLFCLPAFLLLALVARKPVRWLIATGLGVAVVLPLVLFAFGQRGQVDWIQRPTLRSGLGALATLLTFRGDANVGPTEALALALAALSAAAGIAGVWLLPRSQRLLEAGRVGFALVAFFGPWLMLFAISLVWTPYLRNTYLTPSLVGFGVLMGAVAGLGARWIAGAGRGGRWRTVAVASVVAAPLVLSAAMSVNVVVRPWYVDDIPGLGRALTAVARPGDVVAVVQLHNEVGVASGLARVLGDSSYTTELQQQLVTGAQPALGLRRIVSLAPVRTEPIDRVPPTGAVWVVYTRGAISAEDFSTGAATIGCASSDLVDVGSYGILRLASANCTR
ncbi:MAG TPA: glycosyltransferase family 39 protein [Propionicimonas sp.]